MCTSRRSTHIGCVFDETLLADANPRVVLTHAVRNIALALVVRQAIVPDVMVQQLDTMHICIHAHHLNQNDQK